MPPARAAIVLAAGGSSRMGRPKQLLLLQRQPLVVRTVEACLAAHLNPVVVVVGAAHDDTEALLAPLPVVCVRNPDWAEGMASSLRTGIEALHRIAPEIAAALIALCDQPAFSVSVVNRLVSATENGEGIVAARYAGRLGAPALFPRRYFGELLALQGDQGARILLQSRSPEVTAVDLPELSVDLDTPEDWAAYTGSTLPPGPA